MSASLSENVDFRHEALKPSENLKYISVGAEMYISPIMIFIFTHNTHEWAGYSLLIWPTYWWSQANHLASWGISQGGWEIGWNSMGIKLNDN